MDERTEKILKGVAETKGLHDKLLEIQRNAQDDGLALDDYAEKFMAEMKAEGIEVTKDEIIEFLTPAGEGELSQDELDAVAGGGCFHSDEEFKKNGCRFPCDNYC